MKLNTALFWLLYLVLQLNLVSQVQAQSNESITQEVRDFYPLVMNAHPYLPSNQQDHKIGANLPIRKPLEANYLNAKEINYFKPGWELRVASDWDFFSARPEMGKILVIDFKQTSAEPGSNLAYRYLANHNSQNDLYEPWSSSKIFAYTAAIARVRQTLQIGANSRAGDVPIADLITSIHSYEPFGKADGNSNAIATYFANIAGRDGLTALFHDQWLMLANPAIRFRGAYDNDAFAPQDGLWHSGEQAFEVPAYAKSSDDPGHQTYRCEHCGLTGNKPMTTLAQAEWLKRLALHEREPLTRHPYLESVDLEVLFFGTGRSQSAKQVGGMIQGISLMLPKAIALAISGDENADPKQVLEEATRGHWRIWQKIGWGPSETRGSGENVVLAHVSLPHYQGGKEFTIAAQTTAPGDGEIYVNYAGIKMQALLSQSLQELFNSPQP
ncbi:hypothetical protein [Paraglaciecola hydrolytica]|uniref:Serine hydrolase n=1 Tax=Paraglaciecola hydrolytica TaxID=1799789 RepID=A0A136A4A1_9ALTE|nr:hypothetical protein [Paraglaciecola hydrolytica]KXI30051.1 hypothetical protein AX660_08600 [Paraglaciecola hydrolytica]